VVRSQTVRFVIVHVRSRNGAYCFPLITPFSVAVGSFVELCADKDQQWSGK